MKLVQMLQMLIMRSLNASCGICGFANEFGIFVSVHDINQIYIYSDEQFISLFNGSFKFRVIIILGR